MFTLRFNFIPWKGEGQELDDISSGDEEDEYEDEVDGIEMGSPSQFCEDLDCDHTINGNCCKSVHHAQIRQTRLKKKKVKKKTLKEWVSHSYKNTLSALHRLFCVTTKDLLGKWRFTRSLNWYSTPEYVNRLLMIGGKVISYQKWQGLKFWVIYLSIRLSK